jgi:hypothetical protein
VNDGTYDPLAAFRPQIPNLTNLEAYFTSNACPGGYLIEDRWKTEPLALAAVFCNNTYIAPEIFIVIDGYPPYLAPDFDGEMNEECDGGLLFLAPRPVIQIIHAAAGYEDKTVTEVLYTYRHEPAGAGVRLDLLGRLWNWNDGYGDSLPSALDRLEIATRKAAVSGTDLGELAGFLGELHTSGGIGVNTFDEMVDAALLMMRDNTRP